MSTESREGAPAGSTSTTHVVELPDARLEIERFTCPEPSCRALLVDENGRSRDSRALRELAAALRRRGVETFLLDLVTEDEHTPVGVETGLPLLTRRLLALTQWIESRPGWLPAQRVFLGTGTATAAAFRAAALLGDGVRAIVSLAGRPDLALAELPRVVSPALFVVSELDLTNFELHRLAIDRLTSPHRLEPFRGIARGLESAPSIEELADLVARWLEETVAQGPA